MCLYVIYCFQQVDLILHLEESFIRYMFNTRKRKEVVKYIDEDRNQFLELKNDETDSDDQQNDSLFQKIKKFILEPKIKFSKDKSTLVRQYSCSCTRLNWILKLNVWMFKPSKLFEYLQRLCCTIVHCKTRIELSRTVC